MTRRTPTAAQREAWHRTGKMAAARLNANARTRDDYAALTHLSQTEAARVLGVARQTVSKMAKRHGLKFSDQDLRESCRAAGARLTQVSKARLLPREVLEPLAHLTQREAARQLGVSRARLRKAACAHGITFNANAARNAILRGARNGGKCSPLSHLTTQQRTDYDSLKRVGYTRAEALAMIGADKFKPAKGECYV